MGRTIFFLAVIAGLTGCNSAFAQPAGYNPQYYQRSYGYNYGTQVSPAYGSQYYGSGYAPSYYYGGSNAQQYYGGSYYGTAQPNAYYGSSSGYYAQPAAPVDYLSSPQVQAFIQAHTKDDYGKNPPIEIWLDMRLGRLKDHWFEALGGSKKNPTPTGKYTVKAKHEDFYSNKYKAEMPLSVFFTEQCALHVGSLRVRSHGCIHLERDAAQALFDYAKEGDTKVIVHP